MAHTVSHCIDGWKELTRNLRAAEPPGFLSSAMADSRVQDKVIRWSTLAWRSIGTHAISL